MREVGYISSPSISGVDRVEHVIGWADSLLLRIKFRADMHGRNSIPNMLWHCDSPEQAAALEAAINGVLRAGEAEPGEKGAE